MSCGGDDADNIAVAYVSQPLGAPPSPMQISLHIRGELLRLDVPSGVELHFWDLDDRTHRQEPLGHGLFPNAEWSPDGSRFVVNDGRQSVLYDNTGVRIGTVVHSSIGTPLAPAWRPDSDVLVAGISPTIDIVSRDGALIASYDLPAALTAHHLEYLGWTSSQTILLGWLENRVTSQVSVTVGGAKANVSEAVAVDNLAPLVRSADLHSAILDRFPEAQLLTGQLGSGAGYHQPLLFVSVDGAEYTLGLAMFDGAEPRLIGLGKTEQRSFDVTWRMDAVVLP
jgi:hypothetical protein